MLFVMPATASVSEKHLLQLFKSLDPVHQETLLAFAEFLATKKSASPVVSLPTPELIPRPTDESVVKALKRLRASYPMVDQSHILQAASTLMTEHLMHGRRANEVIDDLELLFSSQYQRMQDAVIEKDTDA